MEAWLSGYNACRDGVPNDERLIVAMRECFDQSGSELARKTVEGGLTDEDRAKIDALALGHLIPASVEGAVALLPEEEQAEYRRCQQSVIDARRSANALDGNRMIG